MVTQTEVKYRLKVFKDGPTWCFRIYKSGWMLKEAHRKTWQEALRSGAYCLATYYNSDARNLKW